MAIGSSVPPRAYTRETLTTAFNWLQSQPDSVRTKATTPDALVGLYMQAQRGGAFAQGFDAEAPVSSQAFMSDLKNLAEGLKEFDDSRTHRAVTPPAGSRAQLGQSPTYPQFSRDAVRESGREPSAVDHAPVMADHAPVAALVGELNERSRQMLREVQAAMNLTSEVETLNMMIAMAHKSLKSLLA
jgi:hypothetical protein